MEYKQVEVPVIVKILFPIVITIIAGIIAPISVALIGLLMFGNLIRECGGIERLSKASQNELANLVTILLGDHHRPTMTRTILKNRYPDYYGDGVGSLHL